MKAAAFFSLLAALCACGGATVSPSDSGVAPDRSADGGNDAAVEAGDEPIAPHVPKNHRPSDAPCAVPPPPAGCPWPGPQCRTDADCADAGANARCKEVSLNDCACTFDACAHDTDCPSGQTCSCRGLPYTASLGNMCVPSNCRVDADCWAAGYCSPSPSSGCGPLTGFYCHTPADLCIDDADCPWLQRNSGAQQCVFSVEAGRWQCELAPVCGG